jgi:hypothetical protein
VIENGNVYFYLEPLFGGRAHCSGVFADPGIEGEDPRRENIVVTPALGQDPRLYHAPFDNEAHFSGTNGFAAGARRSKENKDPYPFSKCVFHKQAVKFLKIGNDDEDSRTTG